MQGMMDLGTFGDERLKKKGGLFAGRAHGQAHRLLASTRRGRATTEGIRRFLHNEAVTREIMLSTIADHTAAAALGRHVLAIQNTTELNFSGHANSKRGFGVVGNGRDIGLFLHPVIVVDAGDGDPRQVGHAGGILGLADANIYSRKKAPPGGRKKREAQRRRPRPIATKESGRWIAGVLAADRVLSGAAMVTVIDDREGDIYEKFVTPRAAHIHLLGRADHNRGMSDGAKLSGGMAALPDAKRLPSRVKLRAVRVEEVDPPEGAKPVHWLLLTTRG